MEVLKKKVLKYIKQNTDKLDMQMGFAFLDNRALKKLNVTGDQLKEMFGVTKVEPTDNNTRIVVTLSIVTDDILTPKCYIKPYYIKHHFMIPVLNNVVVLVKAISK